jgi:hypothetical protein
VENERNLNKELSEFHVQSVKKCRSKNDTGSSFMLPSEFKEKWNELIDEVIPDTFWDLFEHPKDLVYILNSSMLKIQAYCLSQFESRTNEIIHLLNIKPSEIAKFKAKIHGILKEFWESIFDMKAHVHVLWTEINQLWDKYVIDNEDLSRFITHSYNLFIYMHFNEPQLQCNFTNFANKNYAFEKYEKSMKCIDGFPKVDCDVIVVLEPPKVENNKYAYMSLPKVVLVIEADQIDKSENSQSDLNIESPYLNKLVSDSSYTQDTNVTQVQPNINENSVICTKIDLSKKLKELENEKNIIKRSHSNDAYNCSLNK